MNMERFDVTIVGAGPAGSSAAISLLSRGYSVLLVDKCVFPRDKICGGFLNPVNWPLLGRLGVAREILASEHEKVTGFRISAWSGREATIPFPGEGGERSAGLGLRRYFLDHILLREAEKRGATVKQGKRLAKLERQGDGWKITLADSSGEEALDSAFLVGADGRNSSVAQRLGLRSTREAHGSFVGFQLHLRGVQGLSGEVQIHSFPGGYAGMVGVGGGMANLCFSVEKAAVKSLGSTEALLNERLCRNPRLKWSLQESRPAGETRSIYPVYFSRRRAYGDRFLLVGDAARVSEPVTGEGIYLALKSGEIAAEVAHTGFVASDFSSEHLASYERTCRSFFASRLRLNRLIRAGQVCGGNHSASSYRSLKFCGLSENPMSQ
jgi:geranylgeranyl reductase family protein